MATKLDPVLFLGLVEAQKLTGPAFVENETVFFPVAQSRLALFAATNFLVFGPTCPGFFLANFVLTIWELSHNSQTVTHFPPPLWPFFLVEISPRVQLGLRIYVVFLLFERPRSPSYQSENPPAHRP